MAVTLLRRVSCTRVLGTLAHCRPIAGLTSSSHSTTLFVTCSVKHVLRHTAASLQLHPKPAYTFLATKQRNDDRLRQANEYLTTKVIGGRPYHNSE